MNWKDEVTDKLRKYGSMSSAARSIPLELHCLEEEAYSLQSAQAGHSGSRSIRAYEDRLMNILVKQQELEILLSNTESWLKIVDRALKELPEWDQKVLGMLYIEQLPASQVCRELGLERSSLYRHRDAALKDLTLRMYGALES